MEFRFIIWPLIFEFIGSTCLGTFVNVMKRSGLTIVMLPLLAAVPHIFCWRVSRAHLNPAVSLANLLRRDTKFNFPMFIVYLFAQSGGHICGLMLSWWFYRNPGRMVLWKDAGGQEQYHEGLSMEFFGSLIFILIHLLSTHYVTSLSANWGVNALVVGTFYGALVYWGQLLAGGSFNPAFGAAQNLTDLWDTGSDEAIEDVWVYVAMPFIAALVAWPIYEFIYRNAYEPQPTYQTDVFKPVDELAQ